MNAVEWLAAGMAWGVSCVLVGLQLTILVQRGQLIAELRAEERCVRDQCERAATHEQFEGITTDGIPIVALTCHRHAAGGWPR